MYGDGWEIHKEMFMFLLEEAVLRVKANFLLRCLIFKTKLLYVNHSH